MASDSFTGSNDTPLATHDSNWDFVVGYDAARIYDNGVSYDAWNEAGFRYTGSNGNTSQIVVKPNSGEKCAPAVRMGETTLGYTAHFSSLSGGNYTYLSLYKNGSWQTWKSGTWSASADHTVRIVASGTSSPVTVNVYVDESLVINSWSDSSSPYTTGLSGIHIIGDGSNDHAFGDDWTDGDTGGASSTPSSTLARGIAVGMFKGMGIGSGQYP